MIENFKKIVEKNQGVDKIKSMKMEKVYLPEKIEKKIYRFWLKNNLFNPDFLPKSYKKPFTICLPPPNVTGELHIGHALNAFCQDILIRKKRMEKFRTLWIPGLDHAGIATQNVVEKQLRNEGKTRFEIGKKEFLKKVKEWVKKYRKIIISQFQKLGCALDWSRLRFTLDKKYTKAVKKAFLTYLKEGLIYQGIRLINWCPRCQTSLSDLEVEYQESKVKLWYVKYQLKNGGFLSVATTRPETILGDVALAVNPNDRRYKKFIGKKAIVPIVNREVPIIGEENVKMDFGTGVVKITPAHDFADYEVAQKHNLPMIQVINEENRITKEAPKNFQGLEVFEAREKIINELKDKNLLEKVEDYLTPLPTCYRCHTILQIIPSNQWFLKMKNLAKEAEKVVKEGKIKFYPKNFEKIYFKWLESPKDWCISRQIWWGHKIPLKNSQDVLDTWFSSALWPFASLGWPEKTQDLKTFYPTEIIFTDRGIINLWVARMIFSGLKFMKEIPFKKVFIHPTVLTKEGKRMSKSLGTGINPISLVEKYGSDATRFGIIWLLSGNQDIKFVEDHLIMGRKFCNKIWNAGRFVIFQIKNPLVIPKNIENIKLKSYEKETIEKLKKTVEKVNNKIENFEFGLAAREIYEFFWHQFCDIFIENFKKEKDKNYKLLLFLYLNSLKLLHPFLPFLTEEIYQKLPIKNKKISILFESWPSFK